MAELVLLVQNKSNLAVFGRKNGILKEIQLSEAIEAKFAYWDRRRGLFWSDVFSGYKTG